MTDRDMDTLRPTGPIMAMTLAVECPRCGMTIEYGAVEDDAATFGPEEDWPVCGVCDVLIDVPRVRICTVLPEPRHD